MIMSIYYWLKRHFHSICIASILLFFVGCAIKRKPEFRLFFAFEQFDQWVTPSSLVRTTEQAHSGQYSYRMTAGAEYGPSYLTTFQALSPIMPREIHLNGWVGILT